MTGLSVGAATRGVEHAFVFQETCAEVSRRLKEVQAIVEQGALLDDESEQTIGALLQIDVRRAAFEEVVGRRVEQARAEQNTEFTAWIRTQGETDSVFDVAPLISVAKAGRAEPAPKFPANELAAQPSCDDIARVLGSKVLLDLVSRVDAVRGSVGLPPVRSAFIPHGDSLAALVA